MPLYGGEETQINGGVVLYEKIKDPGLAVITLNRPDQMNTWSEDLREGWNDAYDMANNDGEVRAILVTGAGRAFCAGADLGAGSARGKEPKYKQVIDEDAGVWADAKGRPANYAMYIPKPVICVINGACAGIGFTLAMHCDIRLSAEGANFAGAFMRRGLILEGGISWTMPRVAGLGNAMDILLTGRKFDASEAFRLGLVQRVFPKDTLMKEAIAYATDMVVNVPPGSLAVVKRMLLRHNGIDLDEAMKDSNRLTIIQGQNNKDMEEGMKSFQEKRSPKFGQLDRNSTLFRAGKRILMPNSKL